MRDEKDRVIDEVVRTLREPVRVDAEFDQRVMSVVHSMGRHTGDGLWARLRRSRPASLPWGLVAAAASVIVIFAGLQLDRERGAPKSMPVQFVLVAPTARSVAVVGDFNDWNRRHAGFVAKHQGDGVWTVTAPIPAGHHHYAFVVDDSVWVADPAAPQVADRDDFGMPGSVLVVSGGTE